MVQLEQPFAQFCTSCLQLIGSDGGIPGRRLIQQVKGRPRRKGRYSSGGKEERGKQSFHHRGTSLKHHDQKEKLPAMSIDLWWTARLSGKV